MRIVKELGGGGRLVAWIVMSAFSERKISNTEDTETELRSDDLTKYWGEGPGDDLLASCADKGVPACFSSLAETGSVYRKT